MALEYRISSQHRAEQTELLPPEAKMNSNVNIATSAPESSAAHVLRSSTVRKRARRAVLQPAAPPSVRSSASLQQAGITGVSHAHNPRLGRRQARSASPSAYSRYRAIPVSRIRA